jgi:CheY-like chemotaxis protein
MSLMENAMPKRVLSVGNCALDHGTISTAMARDFGAEVLAVATAQEAQAALAAGRFDLAVVNRVFDADGDSGLDFIKQLKGDPKLKQIPVMLISNFPEFQQEAQAAGALPGFGKRMVGTPRMTEILRPHLG